MWSEGEDPLLTWFDNNASLLWFISLNYTALYSFRIVHLNSKSKKRNKKPCMYSLNMHPEPVASVPLFSRSTIRRPLAAT